MLTATEIESAIRAGRCQWDGTIRGDALLGTLGPTIVEMVPTTEPIDPTDAESLLRLYGTPLRGWSRYILPPSSTALGQLKESLVISSALAGHISGLSHVARFGLQVHAASPWVERCFGQRSQCGHLVLELTNLSPAPLVLTPNMPLAKIHLFAVQDSDGGGDRGFYGAPDRIVSGYAQEFARAIRRREHRR